MFPRYAMAVRGKEDPGLQVVDFLLWATNRTRQKRPRTDWYDRIDKRLSSSISFQGTPETSGGFILKRMVRQRLVNYPNEALPIRDLADEHEFRDAMCLIERAVRDVAKRDLPWHVGQYADQVRSTFMQLNRAGSALTVELVRRMASHYLRLFDTLPIFSEDDALDPEHWRRVLQARALASTLLVRNVWALRQIDAFILFRRQHFHSDPSWFGR